MSLSICSLNSGSNGNCYYIGNRNEAVLVDAGISCREVEKRMTRLNLHMEKVKAVFISHEHTDHISGLEVLAKKYKLPVYITPPTLKNSRLNLESSNVRKFTAHEPVHIGKLTITPVPKFHDAIDPFSFVVEQDGIVAGVFTDLGHACKDVIEYFKRCHAVFLETNYDEVMLQAGPYPPVLKKRIRGKRGHLSNVQALELFLRHKPRYISHILLSHISENNNDEELVHSLFKQHVGEVHCSVASRFKESEVYVVKGEKGKWKKTVKKISRPGIQLKLFD